jgi:hypothetical protein
VSIPLTGWKEAAGALFAALAGLLLAAALVESWIYRLQTAFERRRRKREEQAASNLSRHASVWSPRTYSGSPRCRWLS